MEDPVVPGPWLDMTPGVRRRTLACGAGMMQMAVTFERGAVLPAHRHPHEQLLHVVSGRLRLTLGGGVETREVGAGESFLLASEVVHEAEALEATTVLDTFSPPREDLLALDRQAAAATDGE